MSSTSTPVLDRYETSPRGCSEHRESGSWQEILKDSVRTVEDLSARLGFESIPSEWLDFSTFPVRVPQPYLKRMRMRDLEDPLLLQVLPLAAENQAVAGFADDPLQESSYLRSKGVLQKYHGRTLFIVTSACAVHCRYCFRREFPYAEQRVDISSQLDEIREDRSIQEVILSGGDPLILSDEQLMQYFDGLAEIEHIDRIRIHTRVPVVIPQRITSPLLELLRKYNKHVVFVVHVNHPAEIDDDVSESLSQLNEVGVTLLNQSVLLRRINDSVETLVELSEKLFENKVLPYYLHMLDRVTGTAHFEVSESATQEIYRGLQARLSGYLVPRLVREQAGEPAKRLQFV